MPLSNAGLLAPWQDQPFHRGRKTAAGVSFTGIVGDNVRIDDFCILSGSVTPGLHIHIAAYCGLFGGAGLTLENFAGLSSRISIYLVSEDFSGESLTNPTIPLEFRKMISAPVRIGRHAIIARGAVVLPEALVGEGVAIGSLSLVRGELAAWSIYGGVSARRARARSRTLFQQEAEFPVLYCHIGAP